MEIFFSKIFIIILKFLTKNNNVLISKKKRACSGQDHIIR